MARLTVIAESEKEAAETCAKQFGWTPDAVREVDSGNEDERAWLCFESIQDAELWDNQI